MKKRALLSVSDKTGLEKLARGLVERDFELISSSGTAKFLRSAGLPVTEVADVTGFPSILGGRVKTLHPAVFGGILARRDEPSDLGELVSRNISPIDLVVCNLYPFERAASDGAGTAELVEQIDIGGVSLLRAAAKNFRFVTVLCRPDQYDAALADWDLRGDFSDGFRRHAAVQALNQTARYDAVIVRTLSRSLGEPCPDDAPLALSSVNPLKYGENPYQSAELLLPAASRFPLEIKSGGGLSYNNVLDLDAAMRAFALLRDRPAVAVIKHTTPCGIAQADTLEEAWQLAHACDPVSSFGGVAAVTRNIDAPFARILADRFLEVLLCPSIDDDALAVLSARRPKLRIAVWDGVQPQAKGLRSTWTGFLAQDDGLPPLPSPDAGRWVGTPRPELWDDLILAWKAAALSKSNAVAMVKNGATVGIGMGFCSRLFAVEFAARQAGEKARGTVMASDAFFPFPDGVEEAARAGVQAIIQPGGSVKDEEVFAVSEKLGVSQFITGVRTFRH